MAGELDVTVAGHPMTIEFLGDSILLRFSDFVSSRSVMSQPLPSLRPIGQVLSTSEIVLRAKVGRWKPIELFPRSSWLIRWLSPAVREMLD
jgi:hypothetical protein